MRRAGIGSDRGTITIFTILSLSFLLVMGGIAIDLAYVTAVNGELQRSMDAAALAGAGKLAFGSYGFPGARTSAQQFAGLNPYRGGVVTLAPTDVEVGIYDGISFRTPASAAENTMVNGVRARYATTVPASFLRLLGFEMLPVAGDAIAVASPPLTPPANTCIFPIAVSRCAFADAVGQFNSSNGCGSLITFVGSGTMPSAQAAAWIDVPGAGPSMAARAITAINDVYNGATCAVPFTVGDQVTTSSPMSGASTVMKHPNLVPKFQARFSASGPISVSDPSGADAYTGNGWVVYVPVIDTGASCPATSITGPKTVVGWTRVVIRGVNDQGVCYGSVPPSAQCTPHGLITVYGNLDCQQFDAPYNPSPAPISALSRRLHLVR
jgi:hypothetical protein